MPIFNWGKLNANIRSKKAQFEQVFLTYQSTVLSAFKEVEDALIAYSKEQERYKALAKAVAANQLAVQLANERYQKGLTAFLDVLTSQTALYQAQSSLVSSESQLSSNDCVIQIARRRLGNRAAIVAVMPETPVFTLAQQAYYGLQR
ncbi:MAG: TolC family protein [Methylobacter sp.]|nr:TolC family protein [Methylobacter sp.]